MKSTITITIPFELLEHLNKEPNRSELISLLLRDHYKKQGDQTELSLAEIREKKDKWLSDNSIQRSALEVFENMEKQAAEREQAEKAEEDAKLQKRLAIYKDHTKEFCDVAEEEIEGIAGMYESERKQYGSFFDWCEAKGIKLKELFQEDGIKPEGT